MNNDDSITDLHEGQPLPQRRSFWVEPEMYSHILTCPSAQTLLGVDGSTGEARCFTVGCKRWSCTYCGNAKIRRLAFLTKGAQPNRFLTLTVDPKLDPDPEVAWLNTHRKPPELFRSLRLQFHEVEYLKVTEVTNAGYPHYHCLLRSSFLPHAVVKKRWRELTGAQIVDIRKVHDTFRAYAYLVKYLTKMRSPTWTDRHVSYSKNFFNPADLEKTLFPELEQKRKLDCHPWQWLTANFQGEEVKVDNSGNYYIRELPEWEADPLGRAYCSLPEPQAKIIPAKEQTHFAGMELSAAEHRRALTSTSPDEES